MKSINLLLLICISFLGCSKEVLLDTQVQNHFWLFHKGAELPVVVEGNTQSKLFMVLLHGGPGGSAQEYNTFSKPFTDILEKDYAMVYYDQRNAGMSRGDWDEKTFTIEQHIEDLDKIIDLLRFKYGNDIKIFLSGHSWGGYLSTAFLLDPIRQQKVKSWINIDGGNHRNLFRHHSLERIQTLGKAAILANQQKAAWETLLKEVEMEQNKNIIHYNTTTELLVTGLMARAETLIYQSGVLLPSQSGSIFDAIYQENYHPWMVVGNGNRNQTIQNQMFEYDANIDLNLPKINIPSLFIYGFYDVRTPKQQAEYVMAKIVTPISDKQLRIMEHSGHSPMQTEPIQLATIIKQWIDKYK